MPTRSELDTVRDDALYLRKWLVPLIDAMRTDHQPDHDHVCGVMIRAQPELWREEVLNRLLRISRIVE